MKLLYTILLAIAGLVVGTHSSSAQALSQTSLALEPRGLFQTVLTAHCDIGHFHEVRMFNHISTKRYRKLRKRLIYMPASCSRPATAQERRDSWRDLHGRHHRHALRTTHRIHKRHYHHVHRHTGRHRHSHRNTQHVCAQLSGDQTASAAPAPAEPPSVMQVNVSTPAPNVTFVSAFYENPITLVIILLLGTVTVGAICWFLWSRGMRIVSQKRVMPKPLIVVVNGTSYEARLSTGRVPNKFDPDTWVWTYSCPIDGCILTTLQTKEGFEKHLTGDHSVVVNIKHEYVDKTKASWWRDTVFYPIRDSWRDRKWFRSWWPFWPRD